MLRAGLGLIGVVCVAGALWSAPAAAQFGERQDDLADPVPPARPAEPPPKDVPLYEPVVPDQPGVEWGLPPELLASLQHKAAVYEQYARKFSCEEIVRLADYDEAGQVKKERVKSYAYLLLRDSQSENVREFRQELNKNGEIKPAEVEDEEPFPPAYAWVFLFSEFHAPYFAFRLVDTRFEGFDLVHEILFRGSLRFTSGKDIREWEGRVLVDAFDFTPIDIVAEPRAQGDRIAEQFRAHASSFKILGMGTKPTPMGYRAKIRFDLPRRVPDPWAPEEETVLRFPKSQRYDTRRAVSPTQLVAVRASTRTYEKYHFFIVDEEQGDLVGSP